MMKIVIPSMMLTWFLKKFNMYFILMPILMMLMFMKLFNNKFLMNNWLFMLDQLTLIMIILTMMSSLLIILSSNSFKKMILFISPIYLTLLFTFSMNNFFNFYIMFELVLIPTMILIMNLGVQPERLQAGIYLIIYTLMASLPLLVSILFLKNNLSFISIHLNMLKFKFIMFLMLAFLVKMPMFFSHLWLPKAHVEAPLEGSMILAAVLLKLGGYGLIRILPMCLNKIHSMNFTIMSISMMGAIATGMNCIRQKDLKSLIAYSSVAHMALVLMSIYTFNYIGIYGAIIMMIAHGLSSSALFFLVNDLYMKMHSRNIILFKGLISILPNIIFWWFLFMAINISAPPSINTFSEIFIMSSLILWNKTTIIPMMLMSFAIASFSLSLFINISHNKNLMLPIPPSNNKSFLSLLLHFIPLILLLMKMETMLL